MKNLLRISAGDFWFIIEMRFCFAYLPENTFSGKNKKCIR